LNDGASFGFNWLDFNLELPPGRANAVQG